MVCSGMPLQRILKKILNWNWQGRRSRRRPRKSCRKGIDKEVQERGLREDALRGEDEERCNPIYTGVWEFPWFTLG